MKKLLVLASVLILGAMAYSQVSVDPTDRFYSCVQNWELRGLVSEVPPMRPYPIQKVTSILETVMENGSQQDKDEAARIYERVNGRKFTVSAATEAESKVNYTEYSKDDSESSMEGHASLYAGIGGDIAFGERSLVSTGFNAEAGFTTGDFEGSVPSCTQNGHDVIFDAVGAGFSDARFDTDGVVYFGTENFYAQAGLYRSSSGNWIGNNLALNESRVHSGNIAVTYLKGKFSYSQQYSLLSATENYNAWDEENWKIGKFHAFHTVSFDINKYISLGIYESVILGEHFSPYHAMPLPYVFTKLVNDETNSYFMGLNMDIKPYHNVLWASELMVENFEYTKFLKKKFSYNYRIAARSGVIFAPEDTFCSKVSFDYLLITPYTFSAYDDDSDTNYYNYTNGGKLLGTPYGPNSDALNFKMDFSIARNLTLQLTSSLSRHGNSAQSLDDEDAIWYMMQDDGKFNTDGSFSASGMKTTVENVDSEWDEIHLLSKDVMTTIQLGISAEYQVPKTRKGPSVTLKAGMSAEYIHNYGIDNEIFKGGQVTAEKLEADPSDPEATGNRYEYTYKGKKYSQDEIGSIVDDAMRQWKSKLCDQFNGYFSVGLCVKF